jgi:serine/threonine protein phosphatase Stp1
MTAPQFAAASSEGTHVGRVRTKNEDACLSRPEVGLWVVADGMGGHQEGALASNQIVGRLCSTPRPRDMDDFRVEVEQRLQEANVWLLEEAARRGADTTIGSTVVILLACDSTFACLWSGDSRIYRLRNDELMQLTRDHTPVQELIDAGQLREEYADDHPLANVITRAVGTNPQLMLDVVSGEITTDDLFLLCSDGLSRMVSDCEICAILREQPLHKVTDALIAAALARGGRDNVTVVVVSFEKAS